MRQWFEMVALSSCLKSLQLHASKAQPCNQSHLPDHFVPWHHKSSYLAQEKNKWRWWELSSYPSGYCCEISSCFKLRPVLCLLCEILMAVLLPPSAGCDAGASMSPSPAQAGHCVFAALSWQQVAWCTQEGISMCLSSPFQHKWNLGELLWVLYILFSQGCFCCLCFSMQWFCLPDFEHLLSSVLL